MKFRGQLKVSGRQLYISGGKVFWTVHFIQYHNELQIVLKYHNIIIGVSLSKPHTSGTSFPDACVCLFAAIHRKF